MDVIQHVKKFPFKSLGSADGSGVTNGSLSPFPYKTNANAAGAPAQSVNNGGGAEVALKEPPVKEPSFSEKDILEAKKNAFEEGFAKGYNSAKSAEAEVEKQIQVSLSDITIKLAAIGEAVKTRNNEHIKELAQLTLKIARKVAGKALKIDPYIEIETVVRETLPILFDEPKIIIIVNSDLVKNIEERIASLAKSEGFKNKIEVTGNPALHFGNCEIEWSGGGIKNHKDAMWGQIENLVGSL